jgi:hypothetical protein
MPRLLRASDRIRLKVPTVGGWQGEAIVLEGQENVNDRLIVFDRADGYGQGLAMRHEVRLLP